MKKVYTFIIILVLVFSLTSCYKGEKIVLHTVLKEVNTARKINIEQSPPDLSGYAVNYKDEKNIFTEDEIKLLQASPTSKEEIKNFLSRSEAIEDVEYMGKLFKSTYAAYDYFGGDSVFREAQEKIVAELSSREGLTRDEFNKIIYTHLKFIEDGHMAIGSYQPRDEFSEFYYYNIVHQVYKEEDNYYVLIDNKKWYIENIADKDCVEEGVQVTLNKKGELVYQIGFLDRAKGNRFSCEMDIVSGQEKQIISIDLIKSQAIRKQVNDPIYSKDEINGIPVITCRQFVPQNAEEEVMLQEFIKTGRELKEEPVLILDLRGNSGGSDMYAMEWFKNYTGDYPKDKETWMQKYSQMFIYNWESYVEDMKSKNIEIPSIEQVYPLMQTYSDKGIWEIGSKKGKWQENENLIIVLVDKGIASSGESMVSYLSTLENVVFVGTNTLGCSLVGNNIDFYLPNSKLCLYFGTNLCLKDSLENEEGKGYLPDIWVGDLGNLDGVIKMIEKLSWK